MSAGFDEQRSGRRKDDGNNDRDNWRQPQRIVATTAATTAARRQEMELSRPRKIRRSLGTRLKSFHAGANEQDV